MSLQKHYVILGDVIASSRQQGVQEKLHEAVRQINVARDDTWVAPFEITRGDEVAVIIGIHGAWFRLLRMFMDEIWPFKMRWVMVYDEIHGGLSFKSSAEAVGPAFIKADALMRTLKETSLYFSLETGVQAMDLCLKGAVNLLLWRMYSLSTVQYTILRSYQKTRNQVRTGLLLKKTQQQVQKSLTSINWEIITAAEESADALVAELDAVLGGNNGKNS